MDIKTKISVFYSIVMNSIYNFQLNSIDIHNSIDIISKQIYFIKTVPLHKLIEYSDIKKTTPNVMMVQIQEIIYFLEIIKDIINIESLSHIYIVYKDYILIDIVIDINQKRYLFFDLYEYESKLDKIKWIQDNIIKIIVIIILFLSCLFYLDINNMNY